MNNKTNRKMLDGNSAAVEALRLAGVKVISAYPITPQSPIAERLSELTASGELDAHYIRVESEHTALSCAIGAQLTGVRTATATSSVGLALMHEILGVASGCRVPIVMPIINRALVSPWSLWCDHQDSMAERDSGWLQFYAENAQEVLDLLIAAYKIAEDDEILLPAMVCFDGFFVSHSIQPVEVPPQETVDRFLPPYRAKNLFLDPRDPMFINDLTSPGEFSEMRFQQKEAFSRALEIIPQMLDEFARVFGRKYEMVEAYRCTDAAAVLVAIGSMAGAAKYAADELRSRGEKVGVLKIVSFRPFPVEIIRSILKGKKIVGVIDRSAGLGAQAGPVWLEVRAALPDLQTKIFGYVAGLGGRDIPEKTIETIFHELLREINSAVQCPRASWIDAAPDAMDIRTLTINENIE